MGFVQGVCCIVFDIDGMLFYFFSSKFHVFSRFMLFPTFEKKNCVKINFGGGGVC